jgi:hypothetical protein
MKTMGKITRSAVALLALGLSSGCATVINGTSEDYKIATTPKGATVALSSGETCVSPCKLKLKRKNHIRADVTLAGYKPTYLLIQSRSGGAVAGNLLLGGIIGGVVDSSNGANNFLAPNPFDLALAAAGSTEEATLRDKEGKTVSTVSAWNDKVRAKVAQSLGRTQAGYDDATSGTQSPAAAATVASASAAPANGAAAAPAGDAAASGTPAPAAGSPAPATSPAAGNGAGVQPQSAAPATHQGS